jgi:hypothetical protein
MPKNRAASTVGIAGLLIFKENRTLQTPLKILTKTFNLLSGCSFAAFVNDFRLDHLHLTCQLSCPNRKDHYTYSISNWVCQNMQLTDLPNTAMIVTDDLRLMDNVHFTTDSYQIIGTRFAEAYWELVEKQ